MPGSKLKKYVAHRRNAPGPFYVVDGCCTACMAPHEAAPTLMGFDEAEGHCFFRRQPADEGELYRAVRAVWSAELQCLRYGGDDTAVLRRLAEIGAADACDHTPPRGASFVLRNHVTFEAGFASQARDVAAALREHILGLSSEHVRYQATPLEAEGEEVKFTYSWFEDKYHPLSVGSARGAGGRWLIRHSLDREAAGVGITLMLDDWLRDDARLDSVSWYTAEAWARGEPGRERPY